MSSTIGVFIVEREPSRRSSWQANHAVSPEQNTFSEIHAMKTFKTLQGTLQCLNLDIQTRYVAASVVTDTHTHKTTTVPLAHAPRVNDLVSTV